MKLFTRLALVLALLASGFLSIPLAQAGTSGAPASFKSVCRYQVKHGYARGCVDYEVVYGAKCSRKLQDYLGKCWVDAYGKYTQCLCGGRYGSPRRWMAPE